VDESGPWREVPVEGADRVVRLATVPRTEPRLAPVPEPVPEPSAPALAVPVRRVTPEPAGLGTPPAKSLADLARERFLDHPTKVRAEQITFFCPTRYLREVALRAQDVQDPRPGRRVATGAARLTCRELTLEAEKIVLRVPDEPDADVQVTARGGVDFVTDQRGQVLRHEGLRILVLSNDRVTPLP